MRDRVRAQLKRSVSAAIVPYGYTLTVTGSTVLASERLGIPGLGALLSMIAGAAAAMLVIETAASGTPRPRVEPPQAMPALTGWAGFQILPAALAVLVADAVVLVLDGVAAWPVIGFMATGTYLGLSAVQFALAGDEA